MTTRPTPEQIAVELGKEGHNAHAFLIELRRHGYRIVHPDDVPEADFGSTKMFANFDRGWNACRNHIFGDTR